jgi:hypothetical protein
MIHTLSSLTLLGCLLYASGSIPFHRPTSPVSQVPRAGDVDPKMPFFLVCAKACDDCARNCDLCASHCAKLVADGKKEHHHTLKLCLDCAAVCRAAASVTARDGPMSNLICTSCADACKQCGDACEKHPGDPIMKQCADECRKCEKVCREMVKHGAHGNK